MKACPEAEGGLSLFQLARLRIQGDQNFASSFCLIKALLNLITGEWQQISVVVTSSHLLLTRWVGHSFFWFNSSRVTPTFNFRDFFTWLFQPGKDQLEVIAAIAIPTIQGLVGVALSSILHLVHKCFDRIYSQSIFEKWPDRLSLKTESGHHRLKLETEVQFGSESGLPSHRSGFQDGVLQLVAALRSPWEVSKNAALEVRS